MKLSALAGGEAVGVGEGVADTVEEGATATGAGATTTGAGAKGMVLEAAVGSTGIGTTGVRFSEASGVEGSMAWGRGESCGNTGGSGAAGVGLAVALGIGKPVRFNPSSFLPITQKKIAPMAAKATTMPINSSKPS